MLHDCPYCGKPIKLKLLRSRPLPGERKFLPNRAVPVCPHCGGALATNTHWSEIVALLLFGIPLLGLISWHRSTQGSALLWLIGIALVLLPATLAYFHFRYWRAWQRYKPYEAPHR